MKDRRQDIVDAGLAVLGESGFSGFTQPRGRERGRIAAKPPHLIYRHASTCLRVWRAPPSNGSSVRSTPQLVHPLPKLCGCCRSASGRWPLAGRECHLNNPDVDDHAKAIAWAAEQPWRDGNVVLLGTSYCGITQPQAAANTADAEGFFLHRDVHRLFSADRDVWGHLRLTFWRCGWAPTSPIRSNCMCRRWCGLCWLHLQFTAEAFLKAAGAEADDADHEAWSGGWAVDCGGVPLCHGSALGRRSREMS
jgi:hypothetical protein